MTFTGKSIAALAVWNAAVLALYWADKRASKRRRRRISEKTLLLAAAFMGAPGALLAMYIFRHKTKHAAFKIGVPLLLVLNILTLYALAAFVLCD